MYASAFSTSGLVSGVESADKQTGKSADCKVGQVQSPKTLNFLS